MYYKIDKETKEMCEALEFYDENLHFPWEKKSVMISLSYKSIEKLKHKNKSQVIESLI